jgi:hypothetical protein
MEEETHARQGKRHIGPVRTLHRRVYSGVEDTQTVTNTEPKKKKKDKVRSAWISFAGRIVAQLVGAVATVALGVMVLHRYTASESRPPAAEPAPAALVQPVAIAGEPGRPAVNLIVITPEMLALARADERLRSTDRGCAAPLDGSSSSTAHFDYGSLLSR